MHLASVEADMLWAGGQTETPNMRPVWSMFVGSDQEMRAFTANLTMGRKAEFPGQSTNRIELLKTARYSTVWQREPEGSIVTTFLPELFNMDPGMVDKDGASFVILPTFAWLADQKIDDVAAIMRHGKDFLPKGVVLEEDILARLVPTSFLFCAYLDRRTRCPLVSDGRFYLQFLLVCLREGLASWSQGRYYDYDNNFGVQRSFMFTESDTEDVGMAPGIAFKANHERLEAVLAEQVSLYFQKVGG